MTKAGVVRTHLWGWNDTSRRVMASAALALSMTLGLASVSSRSSRRPPRPALVVDPNEAPPTVLIALPRLGPVLVGRIVAERARRPFDSLADLDVRVKGIGPATVAAIRPHVAFARPSR